MRPGAQVQASSVQLEVNTLFQTLSDVLHKIDPVNLNATLTALGEGLRGNGDDLGATLSGLNYYLQQLNPKLPTLQQDFQKTAVVANIYADAGPDLARIFDNAPAISNTIVDEQDNLNATLLAATGLANNGTATLEPAENDYIAAVQRLRAPLKVAGDYSPEFGCILKGTSIAVDRFAPIIGGIRPGLFVASNFLPGSPAYTYPESLPIVNASGGPELPWPARHSHQAIRRILVPRTILGHRQRVRPVPTEHRIAVRRAVDPAVPLQRRLRRAGRLLMRGNGTLVKVAIFTVAMLLVAAMLVVVFGEFRFASGNAYHATFKEASRLKSGQDVRIAGVPVGTVKGVKLNPDNTVDVAFDISDRYQLYTSTKAVVRYENLVGDRYLEITSGPGELKKLPPGGTIPEQNTQPALDLDALLGGLRPVLKGLDGAKVNEVSSAVIELLQGQGGALSNLLSTTGAFTQNLAARDQLIGDVINNLNTVLATVDEKSAEFNASVDKLQQLITGLAQGRDPIAGAIGPLASAENDLTDMLAASRRPLQGVIENARPLAQRLDERKGDVNKVIEPLAENYLRLNALGAYGSFFNIYYCSIRIKINGPAGSDILIPFGGPPDPSKGRCSENG